MKQKSNISGAIISLLLLCAFVFPGHSLAQKKINPEHYGDDSDSVPVYHYDMVRNRPDSVARLTIIFNPLVYTVNDLGNDIIQTYCSYDLNKKINLFATASIAFYEEIIPDNPTPASIIPYSNIEIGGNQYFFRKSYSSNSRMYFETTPGTTLSTKFKRNHLIKIGFKGGLGILNSTIVSYSQDLTGYNISDPQRKKYHFNSALPNDKYAYTNAQTTYLSLGIAMENIKDVAVNIEKFKGREIAHKSRVYLDLLASPYSNYDNIIMPDFIEIPKGTYNVNQYSPKQLFGFRIGWNYYSLTKFGIALGAETGIIPNSGGYFSLQIGMAFSPKRN